MDETKRCTKCGETKLLNEFYPHAKSKNGLRKQCKICDSAYQKEKRIVNPEKAHDYDHQYRETHREEFLQSLRKSYQNHKNKRLEDARIYRIEHPDRVAAASRKWRKNHPEAVIAIQHARESKIIGNGGRYSALQWKALVNYYSPDNICLACKKNNKSTVDHVIPLKLGGTNNPSNLQPLCLSCNSRKHKKTIDYRPDGGTYAKWIEENIK